MNPDDITVSIQKVDEAEIDEMWSFVGTKKEPRWLWHAIDGGVLNVEIRRSRSSQVPV